MLSEREPSGTSPAYFDPYIQCTHQDLQNLIVKAEKLYSPSSLQVHEKAFAWLATKVGFGDIYIFATVHSSQINFNNIYGDALQNIISRVGAVYTEIEFDFILHFFAAGPEWAEVDVDQQIAIMAYGQNKALGFLENDIIRFLIEKAPGLTQYSEMSKAEEKNLCRNYRHNIMRPLASCPNANSVDMRNKFWMHIIRLESIQKRPILIACGALHTAGINGLPNILAHLGYTLTPIMKQQPIPRSKQIRNLLMQTRGLHFFKSQVPPIQTPELPKQSVKETILAIEYKTVYSLGK